MATIPGTLAERRAQRSIPSFPTDTGTAFVGGIALSGPVDAYTKLTAAADYADTYGAATGDAALLADWVETAFAEGVTTVYVGRVDDATAPTDAEWAAALALFPRTLGPGQVAAPGRTTATGYTQLLDHAAANNRTALLDPDFEDDKAALLALAALAEDYVDAPRGGLFAQWLQVPQRVAGVDRFVPPSAVVAGLAARLPGEENRQPIGDRGRPRFATAAAGTFTDADHNDLFDGGINVFLDDELGLRLNGFRSVTTDDDWFDLAHNRLFMAVEARAEVIKQQFIGERITLAEIARFSGGLEGDLLEIYGSGALYGATADEAFAVVTGEPVNTDATAAAREISAETYLRAAEHVLLARTIAVKVPVTTSLS